MGPKVSFVVPCFKLAHVLADCVGSILTQSFRDLEVVIMDDCSPDDTTEVAQSFPDPRIRYVRNPHNLGHLANFNKGIALARGKYIWLISADDRLRRPHALARFVEVMDQHPGVGFVFCPAVVLRNDRESHIVGLAGRSDAIFSGHDFFPRLLRRNLIAAPSAMVRRACYEWTGNFPLDLPFSADWFGWLTFALWADVAYVAEPLVDYRAHTASMTANLLQRPDDIIAEEVIMLERIRRLIDATGDAAFVARCVRVIGRDSTQLTARVLSAAGTRHYRRRDLRGARRYYERALREDPQLISTWIKYLVLRSGATGTFLRDGVTAARRRGRTLAHRLLQR